MKKNVLPALLLACSVGLYSCGGEQSTTETSTDSTATEEVVTEEVEEEAPSKNCQLASFSFTLGEMGRTMTFSYEGDQVMSVETKTMGSEDVQTMSYNYENGKLSSFEMGDSKGIYEYDENGNLTAITGEGNINTRTMEYDENGNIVKQVTMFGSKPFTTHEYAYEGDKPVKVTVYDKNGEAMEENTLVYDDKPNEFVGKGVFANSTEMMLGYPVGNYANNVIEITKKYLKKTSYQINGEYKNPGDTETNKKNYEYDEYGYIVKDTQVRGDKEIVTTFTYQCD